jgi:hypothetical protein
MMLLKSFAIDYSRPIIPDNAKHADFLYEEGQIALHRSKQRECQVRLGYEFPTTRKEQEL